MKEKEGKASVLQQKANALGSQTGGKRQKKRRLRESGYSKTVFMADYIRKRLWEDGKKCK